MTWAAGLLWLALSVRAQDYGVLDAAQAQHVSDVIAQVDAHKSSTCAPPSDAPRPNILFFLADDLGFADISWNNATVESPNLDALAKDGIILDRNYVHSICSPSRAAFHTGKYAHRVGFQHSVILPDVPEALSLDHTTLAERLKEKGYKNHILGKWHLGFCNDKYLPRNRGFDSFYGYYNAFIDHYTHEIFGNYDFWDNGEIDLANNMSYTTTLIEERALEIIQNHDGSDPLFLMFSSPLPHEPLQLPAGEQATGRRETYLGMVKYMDETMGKLVQAFKDNGLYDNSIIVFSSDNGGMAGAHFALNEPLRGEKATIFEGGTRVPAMVHSPLQSVKGLRHQGSFHISDWTPTFLNMAGGCADGLDGVNQSDMLLNGGKSARDEIVYNVDQYPPFTYGHGAIRIGDYKLILGFPGRFDGYTQDQNIGLIEQVDILGLKGDSSPTEQGASGTQLQDYMQLIDGVPQLYNVMEDPEERNNLANKMPLTVDALKARIEHHLSNAMAIDLNHLRRDPTARDPKYNGIWTPGWC